MPVHVGVIVIELLLPRTKLVESEVKLPYPPLLPERLFIVPNCTLLINSSTVLFPLEAQYVTVETAKVVTETVLLFSETLPAASFALTLKV